MNKSFLVAVVLISVAFLGWQGGFLTKKLQPNFVQATDQTVSINGVSEALSAVGKSITLGDDEYALNISLNGGFIESIHFPIYKGQKSHNLQLLIGANKQLTIEASTSVWNEKLNSLAYSLKEKNQNSSSRWLVLSFEDDELAIERKFILDAKKFSVQHQASIRFKKEAPQFLYTSLRVQKEIPKEHQENERREAFYSRAGGQEKWSVDDIDELKNEVGQSNWIGFSSRYFLNALIDFSVEKPQFQIRPEQQGNVAMSLVYPIKENQLQMEQTFFYGPKEIALLKSIHPSLGGAVDFGWFTIIAFPMLKILNWIYKFFGNYGIAIILLTLLVKILTYPLTLKSVKGMKEMQRIQPQLAKLKERYSNDKETLNKEMLQLMKANGYNPMSGCFPIFIQMPIFIALYNVLYGAIDLYGQPFFGWINDLSAKDPYYITPALLALTMFVQQRLTPATSADPAQQKMMLVMPLIFGFMMLWLPSGLTLYMLVNSVISILMQMWIQKRLGVSVPTIA